MLTKPRGNRTWASVFPNMFDPLEDRQMMKDWRLGIHFRPVDLSKYEETFTVKMEIPGLRMEDFNVEIKEGNMIIIAETNEFITKETKKCKQQELIRHFYKRVYKLPEDIKTEEISVSFNDDVLTLALPRTKEALVE